MNLEPKIRVMTVDDHPIALGGIAYALQDERDIEIVTEGGSGTEAIQLYPQQRPDVTLIDLRLPDMSGIAAMEEILKSFPDGKFIILTTYHGDVPAKRAYRAGALGYLFKSMLSRDLVQTIRRVHSGERVVLPEVAESIEHYASATDLTDRETAVLRLVAAGNSNKVVAAQLNVSAETVKGHMKLILGKLGAGDRTHAVTIAQQRGFLAE
ncbi:MAG: two component transcriptional regulator, LuxR family [Acidobacteriaceae bacterium]|nr:two component transcriptional regulator, LuxR family [Acidobacteriaceae bacterium]